MLNAPSLANAPWLELGEKLDELVEAGVQMIHIDIMDGHYVPNLCFPTDVIGEIKKRHPQLIVDAHLMVDDVPHYVSKVAEQGADAVSFPSDATAFARRNITQIKSTGMKAGAVINPSQRVDVIEPYFSLLDYTVLMTVEPGFAGQKFLPGSLDRVSELNALRTSTGSNALIEIDGGVDYDLAAECLKRGANILVTNIYTVFLPGCPLAQGVDQFTSRMAEAGFHHSDAELNQLRRELNKSFLSHV